LPCICCITSHWMLEWTLPSECFVCYVTQSNLCLLLKGNSALKNVLPKINIYDKWIYVSVIKLTMQIRYGRVLTIKLLISRNVFLHGGRSSKPSSLFLYLCLFVDVDMVTKNGCSYVLSCVKTCIVSTVCQEILQSFDPHLQPFSISNAFINSRSSTVSGAIIYAWVTLFVILYAHWLA